MKRILPCLLMSLLSLAAALQAAQVDELLRQGDELYARRGEPGLAAQALARYGEALRQAPEDFAAVVRNLQALYFVGDSAAAGEEKKRLFKLGMDLAARAVVLEPKRVEGHYWLGVHTGSYGQARGVLKSLFLKNDIIRAMERAIAIDPGYEQAGAYCVLGRLYYEVPGLFGGSKKKSRQYLETCRGLAPRSSVCLLFLAETYWALDEERLAIQALEELLALAPHPDWRPETEADQKEGAALLRKYKK